MGFRLPNGELEDALRCQVYRLARPRIWERMKFCLDKPGCYHPEWRGRVSKVRAEWRGTKTAVWLKPHPMLASLRQREQSALAWAGASLVDSRARAMTKG